MLSTSKSNRILKLAELEVAEPRKFWAAVKKITKTSHTEKTNISPSSWTDYFRDLLNIKYNANPSNDYADYVENCLHTIEKYASEGSLDHQITMGELSIHLQKDKNGKSTGPDLINNEMLKYGGGGGPTA